MNQINNIWNDSWTKELFALHNIGIFFLFNSEILLWTNWCFRPSAHIWLYDACILNRNNSCDYRLRTLCKCVSCHSEEPLPLEAKFHNWKELLIHFEACRIYMTKLRVKSPPIIMECLHSLHSINIWTHGIQYMLFIKAFIRSFPWKLSKGLVVDTFHFSLFKIYQKLFLNWLSLKLKRYLSYLEDMKMAFVWYPSPARTKLINDFIFL